ncbi:DUF3857 domain-containing protein [Flavobacterium sp. MAH-1]|uniref:DUF3857 domain-containing protein n=1 Tax=Flavobacterium agri TaxID=2743471 RepID=A0A7Y8Y1L1_9FLAO|nr:transglutaminase domain-containing protein [Flavobacterium agri]NUY80708.1 DUF3857 domain-containing protein [Flavobacterium agri]NYA70732.1 DUF3857 domain-containing protein [Flavobacterium agri]
MSTEEYKKKWGDTNELILTDKNSYDIFVDGKKLRVIRDNYHESIILSENGILNNEESFSYSGLVQLMEYDAFSVIRDKGKERKMKVTQSNEKQSRQNSVFHNDVKERQLIFPNLQPGARKVYSVKTEFLDPYLLQGFMFENSLPTLECVLEVRTSKDINIGYRVFNDPNNSIEFSKTEKKGKWVYRWILRDSKAVKYESNIPGFRHIVPHIDFFVKDYMCNGAKVEVLDDTDKLYKYYQSFVKDLNKKEDVELKSLSIDLTSGLSSDAEKMKKIFYWVKDNIKYIAFENGYEGFIPREASLVFERKFGDCKDMASIITSMAHYAGIPNVSVCWIGTREIPYSYKDLSTPAVDNHMIALFNDKGNFVFLDATDRETLYGLPTAFIQGKEALVGDGDTYKIIPVPVVPAETNNTSEKITLTIDKNKLIGKGNVSYSGYSRSNYLAQIGDASNKTRFDMIKSLVLKGNNKFNLKEYTESNIAERDKPYQIDYSFDLADYAVKIDKEMYIGLILDPRFEKFTLEDEREYSYEFDFLTSYKGFYTIELPKNLTVKHLPENAKIENNLFSASFTYSEKPGMVSVSIDIQTKKLLLEKQDFALWNQSIEQLKNIYSQTLTLLEK